MKKLFIFYFLVFAWYLPAHADQDWSGKVVGVSDGDTITVLVDNKTRKVRLAEIDAPEKHQAFGAKSKQSLSDMVFGKQVTVNQRDIDRYGRVVGRVYVGNFDVNAEQIKQGMAWVYKQYSTDASLLALENEARVNKNGLWSEPNPIPPWEFRRGDKSSAAMPSESTHKNNYQCGQKTKCGQMVSCEEARFYLEKCGLKRLDRDHDGIPCESICR